MADLRSLTRVLKAAGEGTRLRLLLLLGDGQHSVKDLTEILGQSQPRVSRHLKLLADAGLVVRQAEGAWAYYGLAENGPAGDLARWLMARSDADDPDRLRDQSRLSALREAQRAQAALYFAKVAASWDLQRTLHVPDAAVEGAMLDLLEGRQCNLVLDLGTGTGRMLELLAPVCKRAIGIDSSREMLAVARARLAAAKLAHLQVRLGDIAALDPSVGPADLVVLHQVLHYFDDPGRLLAGIRPAMTRDGEMLIVDFSQHDLEFLRTEHAHRRLGLGDDNLGGWARSAGLEVLSVSRFPNVNKAVGLTVCLWHLRVSDQHQGDQFRAR